MNKKTIFFLSIIFALLFTVFFILHLIKGDTARWLSALAGIIVSLIPISLFFIKKKTFNSLLLIGYYFTLFYAIILGEILHFYDRFNWWDTSLHYYTGIYMAYVSQKIYIHYIPCNKSKNISRFFIFLFVFSLPVLGSVVWEIFEFVCDKVSTKVDMQEGGNNDTMVDLIANSLSAFITAIFLSYRK